MSTRLGGSGGTPRPVHRGGPALAVGAAAFAAALLALLLSDPHVPAFTGTTPADGGSVVPLWAVALPIAVGLALTRFVPPEVPAWMERRTHKALRGRPLGLEVVVLLVCLAVAVTAGVVFPPEADPAAPRSLILPAVRLVVLVGVPLVMFRALLPGWRRGAPRLTVLALPREWWRWGGLAALAGFAALLPGMPWTSWMPRTPAPLGEPAFATDVNALFGLLLSLFTFTFVAELFFRVWLQTRIEILYGRWAGILLTALAFAVAQLSSLPGVGALGTELAVAVAVYGGLGVFLGYLWARYRNLWLLLLGHGAIDSAPMIAALGA